MHVSSQDNKQSYQERILGKQKTYGKAPQKKGSIRELIIRTEAKEEFRNVLGFRKNRALPELTLAWEFKAITMSCYFSRKS